MSGTALELRAQSVACVEENGLVQLGWELPDSTLKYVSITLRAGERAEDDLAGHSHYVEVSDQLHGKYGGLEHVAVLNAHQVVLRLNYRVPGVDADLVLTAAEPIPPRALAVLRRVEALMK